MKIVQTLPPLSELGFGKVFAPWMVISNYRDGHWEPARIVTTEEFRIQPTAKVLHYAQEIFEGLKAFKLKDGRTGLFRPRENIRRMVRSAEILAMPAFPEDMFLDSMKKLVARCQHLVPAEPGALYLRPTMIATDSTLGVAPSTEYCFFNLASPVGGYFGATQSDVPAAVSVWATSDYVRAVRGGLGAAKTGANYAASLRAVDESKKRGFQNVLFLDAIERKYLEELSGMNIFIVENGVLKTPALGDTILDGVTRKSLIALARLEKIPVEETSISIDQLTQGARSGAVTEMFACGTGASLTAVTEIGWNNERLAVGGKKPGEVSTRLYRRLLAIQTGDEPAPAADWIEYC